MSVYDDKEEENELRANLENVLLPLMKEELQNRTFFRELYNDIPEVDNRFDFISDQSLESTGFSKIVFDYNGIRRTLSLTEFLSLADPNTNNTAEINGVKLSDVLFHKYYSDECLEGILNHQNKELIQANSQLFLSQDDAENQWNYLINHQYKDGLVPLSIVQYMFAKVGKSTKIYKMLRKVIESVECLRIECDELCHSYERMARTIVPNDLEFSNKLHISELQLPLCTFDVNKLNKLTVSLKKCSIYFPELSSILAISRKIVVFQYQVRKILEAPSVELLREAYLACFTIPLEEDYVRAVIAQLYRMQWLQIYENVFGWASKQEENRNSNTYSIQSLESFLGFGLKYCSNFEVQKLRIVKSKITEVKKVNARVLKLIKGKKPDSKIMLKDLYDVMKTINTNTFPVDELNIELIKKILGKLDEVKHNIDPLWNKLSINENFVENLLPLIRDNSMDVFPFLKRFNGSEQDERLVYADVKEHYAMREELKASFKILEQ